MNTYKQESFDDAVARERERRLQQVEPPLSRAAARRVADQYIVLGAAVGGAGSLAVLCGGGIVTWIGGVVLAVGCLSMVAGAVASILLHEEGKL